MGTMLHPSPPFGLVTQALRHLPSSQQQGVTCYSKIFGERPHSPGFYPRVWLFISVPPDGQVLLLTSSCASATC